MKTRGERIDKVPLEHFIHSVATPACDMLAQANDVDVRFKKKHRRTG